MIEKIKAAYDRLNGIAIRTPIMTSGTLNNLTSAEIFLKCENFQKVGAFKFRGAYNAMSQLTDSEKSKGVITHSSGNHAQALALAANKLGINSIVVMPETSPKVKKDAVRNYGAKIVECKPTLQDREETTKKLIEEHGFTFIHPYNNWNIIYGAGTAAYELLEDVKDLDIILAPVGGGGLLSGTSLASKNFSTETSSKIKVYGVEPLNADDAYRSFMTGKIVPSENPNTIADGLLTSLGEKTFETIKKNVDGIITVSEKEILDAMRFLWERMKIVVEPSGAVSVAGVLCRELEKEIKNKRVGVIISGGNIDLSLFFNSYKNKIK